MKRLFLPVILLSLFTSGCGLSDLSPNSEDTMYKKVSMTLDVATWSDGSISAGACFGQGTIATVLYFDDDGGEPVAQRSTLTVHSVPCLSCESRITDSTTTFPIELSAVLDPHAVEVSDEAGNSLYMKDELRFWIDTPPIHSLNIYYECGGAPDTLPDYGSAVSQIAGPFLTSVWTQDLVLNEVQSSSFENYAFPPVNIADVTISVIETLVSSTSE